VIDTHCHLTFPDFSSNIPAVLADAAALGVTGCIAIATTTIDCLATKTLATAHPRIWHTAGVHPLYSDQTPHLWQNVLDCALSPKCVAWGELGLDRAHATPPILVQLPVLHEQLAFIQAAHAGNACERAHKPVSLPIVLHCREAFDDLLPILKQTTLNPARFVFHCFTAGPAEMRKILDFGAMVSFTGVITYKNAQSIRDAAILAPLDRIMIETDSPFLSPEPKRGVRPCQPGFARYTAEAVATLKGIDWDTFHNAININTSRFFNLPGDL